MKILLFREYLIFSNELAWVAISLECDLAAQGTTFDEAKARMRGLIELPHSDDQPAPMKYWDMFDRATPHHDGSEEWRVLPLTQLVTNP